MGGDREPGQARELGGQERALERLDHPVLALVEARVADRQGRAVGDEREQRGVVVVEAVGAPRADEHDPADLALGDKGHADQRAQLALAVPSVITIGRRPLRRVPRRWCAPGAPARQPPPWPLPGWRGPPAPRRRRQEHRGRVGAQDLGNALEQLGQEVVQREVGERRVADVLEVAHHVGDHLGLGPGGLLAQPLGALLLRPLARGHVLELRDQLDAPVRPDIEVTLSATSSTWPSACRQRRSAA